MILYNNDDVDNLLTDTHWVPSVHVDNTGAGGQGLHRLHRQPSARIETVQGTTWKTRRRWRSSPPGAEPDLPDIIKPDVTGPGVHIVAANSPSPDRMTPRGNCSSH